ncbi:tetratricopeptide repeat protein [Streptomyces sp. 3211.6]|uniref:tetratricopeptide repeat protein n=1 Tax=Streptomyces sp. 3211.6 TaxID=1938845 RepID=UPI0021C90C07|nr:tetratricopeptide repeat protein [Streptomyces sp. 3211.6]
MNIDGHPPAPRADGKSPWGGLSGAALFCEDLLTGVIAVDPGGHSHAALEAVPAYMLLRDDAFRSVLAEHGAGASTVLEAVEWQHLDDTLDQIPDVLASPTVLLHARNQIVPFRGRADLVEQLQTWSQQPGFGAYLLHGPGGQGKTRLAQHLTDILSAGRSQVLWLAPSAAPESLAVLAGAARPLLVVVDYAEIRAPQILALLEAAGRHRGSSPFRLLLLARTAGDWWENLQTATRRAEDLLDDTTVTGIGPLEPTPGQSREQAYKEALDRYAQHLPNVRDWQHHPWPSIADKLRNRSVDAANLSSALTLHMTALADLLDTATTTQPDHTRTPLPSTARTVEDRLLFHERRYWTNAAETRKLTSSLGDETLTDALAAAFLIQGCTNADADTVLRRIPGLADETYDRRRRVRTWIASLYPPASSDRVWGLLQPDRLAEWFVGRHLTNVPTLAHHLSSGISRPQADQLLTLYTRAAAHFPLRHLGPQLTDLIAASPGTLAPAAIEVASQSEHPTPILDALQQILDSAATSLDDLTALANELPAASQMLAPWAALLTERTSDAYRQRAQRDPRLLPDLASSLDHFAGRLRELGRLEEALAISDESMAIYFGLATSPPYTHLPDLAASLSNHAVHLEALGRMEDALVVIKEAVTIHRNLVATRPDLYLPDLARSLQNLGSQLRDVRELEEAITASQEAVMLYRSLSSTHPDLFLPALAGVLSNLGTQLGDVGRTDEALAAANEAVALHRDLATRRPDTYLPDLARTLSNLAAAFQEADRMEEALTVSNEAVALHRDLATRRPDTYLPELGGALHNLGSQLWHLGRTEDALAAAEEVVTIYRSLATTRPGLYLPHLARSLSDLAANLAGAGRMEDTHVLFEEAVPVYRTLATTQPDTYLPDLALGLHNVSAGLFRRGRTEEALSASKESVSVYRDLAERHPGTYLHQYAGSLNDLAEGLARAGRIQESLNASEEAVIVCRDLAANNPETYLPRLAANLDILASSREQVGRTKDAHAALEEAVTILRGLAAARPDRYLPHLADYLKKLSAGHYSTGGIPQALAAVNELVTVYHSLATAHTEVYLPALDWSQRLRSLLQHMAEDGQAP